jgi:hypothetical protein
MLRGEAFESLERGIGASVAVSTYFSERYAVRGRFSTTRNAEGSSLYDDRTTTLEAWLELRWVRSLMGLQFEAGPTVGYARLSRPMYLSPINGFLAGLGVGAERSLFAGFRIVLGVDVTLTSFNAPPIAFPSPPGWDDDADGDRLSLSIGLAHRWPRG